LGLIPAAEVIEPVPQDQWKSVIEDCHARKIFAMYHRAASTLPQKPSQNGLNYCWAWSLCACLEDTRLLEGQPAVKLAPTSAGWLVNWWNSGGYLDVTIAGVQKRGLCSANFVPSEHVYDPAKFSAGWEADAINYRTSEWWDVDCNAGAVSVIGHALAILRTGRPGYIAYKWWSHALALTAMWWDTSQTNSIVWGPFNSHGDGLIQLAGSKGVPDELYGVRSTSLPAGA